MGVENRALVKAWLSFYHGQEGAIRYGQMGPGENDGLFSTIRVERGCKAYISYGQCPVLRVPLTPAAAEIHFFNCTNDDVLRTILIGVEGAIAACVYSYDLEPMGEATLRKATLGAFDGSLFLASKSRREAWLRSAGVGSSAYENQGSEGI